MTDIKLSKRLGAIASLIPEGGGAADVGTDHGFIPVWLCQRGKNAPVFAGDINPEPLERAALTAAEYGEAENIHLVLCNGLEGLDGSIIDNVIIAGMGGETIISILENAPWTKQPGKTLVLQPMTKSPELRRWLFDNGYMVKTESLVEDGKLYELLAVCGGQDTAYSKAELHTGHFELISADPLLPRRLEELINKARRAAEGLSRSGAEDKQTRLEELECLISGLSVMQAGRTI